MRDVHLLHMSFMCAYKLLNWIWILISFLLFLHSFVCLFACLMLMRLWKFHSMRHRIIPPMRPSWCDAEEGLLSMIKTCHETRSWVLANEYLIDTNVMIASNSLKIYGHTLCLYLEIKCTSVGSGWEKIVIRCRKLVWQKCQFKKGILCLWIAKLLIESWFFNNDPAGSMHRHQG